MDRSHRLTSSRDFARVSRHGKRGSAGPVTVAVVLTGEDRGARVGVAARSGSGSVARNRSKRLLRETIRPLLGKLPAGADIVLRARKDLDNFQEVEEAVNVSLRKASVEC